MASNLTTTSKNWWGFRDSKAPYGVQNAQIFEAQTTPIDWQNLNQWIDKAISSLRRLLKQHFIAMAQLDMDSSNASIMDIDPVAIRKKINEHPEVQFAQHTLGPNWESNIENFWRFVPGLLNPSVCISMDREPFLSAIEKRTSAILRDGNTLNDWEELALFRERWAQWSTSSKTTWLEKKKLPRAPQSSTFWHLCLGPEHRTGIPLSSSTAFYGAFAQYWRSVSGWRPFQSP